jgi:hypothetical protein
MILFKALILYFKYSFLRETQARRQIQPVFKLTSKMSLESLETFISNIICRTASSKEKNAKLCTYHSHYFGAQYTVQTRAAYGLGWRGRVEGGEGVTRHDRISNNTVPNHVIFGINGKNFR